jgi:parvulin-like peptidyl-prolyl isomerase
MAGCAKYDRTSPSSAASGPEPQKIVVSRVNGVPLYMDALVAMMNRLPDRDNSGKTESLEEHRKKALDRLVLQELAYQQATSQGASIGADKVDMAIGNFKDNLGGEKAYSAYLSQQNVTEARLRAQVERSLTIELMYAKEVLARVSVPEDDMKREYEREKNLYVLPEKISAVDVLILDRETAPKTAQKVLRKIKADADKDPWHLVLDGSFTVQNIEIKQKRDAPLYEAARKLKPGDLSGVLTTETGTHIIKLITYSPEKQFTFDEVRNNMELKFKTAAQERRTREWEQELKQNAKIEIVTNALL